jgi:serine/threonine-protein kinase
VDDPAIFALERADRVEEAAALALERGRFTDAARLFERACRYRDAATAALAAHDAARAVELAARAGDDELEQKAAAALAATPELAARTAARLSDLGRFRAAGRVLLAIGDAAGAATALERGAVWLEAASAHERAGDVRKAAHCLETAIARDGSQHAARLALGSLLLRHGRADAAVRVLQAIPEGAAERGAALQLLRGAFERLGLGEAVRETDAELARRGQAPAPAPYVSPETDASETVLFGRYRVLDEVARTPTARVVRAEDRLGGGQVAVKLISAVHLRDAGRDALRRFEREAVVLGELRHPAIVPLVAYLPEGPAVVLRWMAGGSLADALAAGSLSPARAVEVALSVLGALAEAHRRGILHRDIKPANVLFDEAGAAYLADFGTAHVADAAATVTSGVIGTIAYMAPEQRSGRAANPKSDLYGVGALLCHALTGGPPEARLPLAVPELGPEHRAVLDRLLAPEADRPESAQAAQALLRSLAWPTTLPRAHAARDAEPPPPSLRSVRLEPSAGGRHRDRLLGRELIVLPASGAVFERVLAFARADHPGLAAVLALRPEARTVWVEAVTGEPLARKLEPDEAAAVRDALAALHRAGGYHGAVDRAHVVVRAGAPVLAFPLEPTGHDAEADLRALAEL